MCMAWVLSEWDRKNVRSTFFEPWENWKILQPWVHVTPFVLLVLLPRLHQHVFENCILKHVLVFRRVFDEIFQLVNGFRLVWRARECVKGVEILVCWFYDGIRFAHVRFEFLIFTMTRLRHRVAWPSCCNVQKVKLFALVASFPCLFRQISVFFRTLTNAE